MAKFDTVNALIRRGVSRNLAEKIADATIGRGKEERGLRIEDLKSMTLRQLESRFTHIEIEEIVANIGRRYGARFKIDEEIIKEGVIEDMKSKNDKEIKWKFRALEEDSILQDPIESSFFANNDDSDNLVREAIQNSLDAQINRNNPVKMKFTFSTSEITDKRSYIKGIKKHLNAIGKGEDFDPGIIEKPMSYVVVEDFNTRGLQGDPEYSGLMKGETKENRNDFYWFYRNRGRSGKTDEQRGRWGLGKRVFPQCSAINAFIGYTIRESDNRKMVMGQCVLKTHELRDVVFDNTGFFSIYDKKPMPVENEDFISKLCIDFNLKRHQESGFSAIIPYPNKHVNFNNIMRACVRHFFYPIITGDLVIELFKEESKTIIDKKTFDQRIEEIDWKDKEEIENILKLADLTKWSLSLNPNDIIRLNKAGDKVAPQWTNHIFDADIDWDKILTEYRNGKRLAFRIPFYIKKKNEDQQLTYFDIFLEEDRKMLTPRECYIREGLSINAIRTLKTNYIRGIVVVKEPSLSAMLGDAEDPSHKDWKEKQEKLKNNYDRGVTSVRFVKNALVQITNHLTYSSAIPDKDLIAEIKGFTFSVIDPIKPKKERKRRIKKGKDDGDATDDGEVVVPPPSSKKYIINKTFDGFNIKNSEDFDGEEFEIMIRCAYSTPEGDPFKNYEKYDFIMGSTVFIEGEGAIVENEKEHTNLIRIRVTDKIFKVSVNGFDTNRDLEIKARAGAIKDEA